MLTARRTLEFLLDRQNLDETQAADLLVQLTDPELPAATAGALLAALRGKGLTAIEVRGFAKAMRKLARTPMLAPGLDAIDIVGTGGDASGSLNLSTGASFLTAACGLPVIKHGNRSVSSRSGSADVIEQLGLTLPLDEQAAADCFAATGFTFLYAPYFHPAMKAIAPVRAVLGIRTVFNLLGPLTNPAAPRFNLIGAFDAPAARLIADALLGMDIECAWVVHGAGGWDEPTPVGPFLAYEVTRQGIERYDIDPRDFGLQSCSTGDLAGGTAAQNLAAMREVFVCRDRGAHRAALVLQCGLALFVGGRVSSIAAGIETAGVTLDSGRAAQWFERLQAFAAS